MNKYYRYVKSKIDKEDGQAALELAIILPILLMIIMFIIYIGIFAFSKSAVLIAAHEGGREGLQLWNNSDISQDEKEQRMKDAIYDTLTELPRGNMSQVLISDDREGLIRVNVTYYFSLNLPFVGVDKDSQGIPIRSNVTYRYIQD